jgi:RHS repeat-associated protein
MTLAYRLIFLMIVLALTAGISCAQVQTGTPPFGSFGGGPDVINLANLNSHLTVPVLHKPGRGNDFTYDLVYDSSIWFPVAATGHQTWQPVGSFGWAGQTEVVTGYVASAASYSSTQQYCGPDMGYMTITTWTYSGWVYTDSFGVSHAYRSSSSTTTYSGCGNNNSSSTGFAEVAADGSGYTLNVSGGCAPCSVISSSGTSMLGPYNSSNGSGNGTDRNGNMITVDSSGHFYDTLSSTTPVLAVTGLGTVASPTTFAYTAPSGASAHYTMNYTNYTVATNFGISGITEYRSAAAVPLVSSIVLPDGSQYSFLYEATPSTPAPGACTPYAGTTCVTARIAKVTLPTGGQIIYAYTGGNNGILPDGSTATLGRTTPDGAWTYAQVKGTAAASTTTITDPQSNVSVINFQGIYETQRQVYQGTTSGTLLTTMNTCYNASASPCTGTAITLPLTQRTVIDQYGSSGLQCKHNYLYNGVGGLTEQDDYDYGSGGPGGLLRKTLITYASLESITAFRQQVTVQNGSGTVISQTNYNYDETTPTTTSGVAQHASVTGSRGNLTSINYPVSGLTSHFTYYDTGSMSTQQDVNSATTTYNYSSNTASCQMAFPTGVTEPLSMSESFTWNCTGGVQLTSTDENSKTTTVTYNDADFWRPNAQTDQLGNQTSFYYQPNPTYGLPVAFGSSLTFNNGNSVVNDIQYTDSLGRTYVDQRSQSPGSSTLDSVSYTFDANGRPYSVSVPCSIAYAGTCSTPKTTQTYDALNRLLQTTDGGGGTATYSYSNNDVLITVGPAPTGENTKRRQLEYDALGRLTSVCELTSGTTAWPSGACAQTTAQTGYWTKYSYDALGDLLTVTQNAQAAAASQQTRTYTYDAMGRLISEKNPEMAQNTLNYVYDTDATCTPAAKGDLVKRIDPVGNTTCYTYDALHRSTSTTYTGPYASNTPNKYFVYDTATVNSVSMSNAKTRLAEAYTCVSPCTTKITDLGFSYSARGEATDVYESTPHSGGYYHPTLSYWANGAPNVLGNNIVSLPAFTYSVDGEGRPYQVTASAGQNPVTNTVYNTASQPTSVTFGSSDSDAFQYDANTLRMTQYKFNVGAQSILGNLGWNANGSLASFGITDPFNSADAQNCAYNSDDLSRISKANCGAIWGQSFAYDPFGNISKTVLTGSAGTSFLPTYQTSPSITNRIASLPGGITPTYDANGNSTNDNFHQYTWDAENRPVSVNGTAVVLTYDALGRMVEQARGTSYTQIVYSPIGSKLATMNGSTLQKGFLPLINGGEAVYTSGGLAYYRHPDHLGSSRFSSTPTRTLYSDTAYSAFGEPYAQAGTTDASFTGEDQDTTAGVYDFLYRKYDPGQSRWTSTDPAGLAAADKTSPQSWNRYAYVLNNPLRLVDPQGLDGCEDSGFDDESSCDPQGGNSGPGVSGGGTDGPCTDVFGANPFGESCTPGPSTTCDGFGACTPGSLNAGAQPNLPGAFNEGPGGYDYGGVNVFVALECAAQNNPGDTGCWGVKLSLSGGALQGSWSLDGFAAAAAKPLDYLSLGVYGFGKPIGPYLFGPLGVFPDPLDPSRLISLKPAPFPAPTSRAYVCQPMQMEIRQLQLQTGNPSAVKQLAALQAMYQKACH